MKEMLNKHANASSRIIIIMFEFGVYCVQHTLVHNCYKLATIYYQQQRKKAKSKTLCAHQKLKKKNVAINNLKCDALFVI